MAASSSAAVGAQTTSTELIEALSRLCEVIQHLVESYDESTVTCSYTQHTCIQLLYPRPCDSILILCMHVHISDISAITAIMERLQGHACPRPPKLEDNVNCRLDIAIGSYNNFNYNNF